VRKNHKLLGIVMVWAVALAACAPGGATATPGGEVDLYGEGTAAPGTAAAGATTGAPTGADSAPTANTALQWPQPPEMTIDPAKFYIATLKTEKGDIVVELLADKAPVTVNNFVFLARQGYYDNTTFHRVLDDFMAQGGDPTGSGSGGPGYEFQDEFHPDLTFDGPGLLAMANAGPGTNGSQFFITFVATPHLNNHHTIFGRVLSGMEVALALTRRDPSQNPSFQGDRLLTVEIQETDHSQLPAVTEAPPPTATPVPLAPEPQEGRPLAELPFNQRASLFNTPPAMVIDPSQPYSATLETTRGNIVIELYAADAPTAVNNFVVLAGLGYWDEFPWVYVEPGQFALTGSPAAAPTSDIGYTLAPEYERPNVAGSVGFWFRDDVGGSSGSQVYLLLTDAPSMDGHFGVFGAVTEGLAFAQELTGNDRILRVTVQGP
jgi:peptidyl-prolyl cis-trans isomerase B (cyclophilin B)